MLIARINRGERASRWSFSITGALMVAWAISCCWVSSILRSDKQAANGDAMVYRCTGSVYHQRGLDLRATPGDVICGLDGTQPVTSVTSQAQCGSRWFIVTEGTETSRSEQQACTKAATKRSWQHGHSNQDSSPSSRARPLSDGTTSSVVTTTSATKLDHGNICRWSRSGKWHGLLIGDKIYLRLVLGQLGHALLAMWRST